MVFIGRGYCTVRGGGGADLGLFLCWRELPFNVNCTRLVLFRYIGTVLAVKPKKGTICRVRVKFDMYPKDKYDKW